MLYSLLLASGDPEALDRRIQELGALRDRVHLVPERNSVQALQQVLAASAPDILITDARLPGGNALEEIRTLQEKGLQSHIIVISDASSFEIARLAICCHADALLLSPSEEKQLGPAVRRTIRQLDAQVAELYRMKYRKVIGQLFLDQSRIARPENQVSAEISNARFGTHFCEGCYRMAIFCIDTDGQTSYASLPEELERCTVSLFEEVSGLCYEVVMRFSSKRVHILLNYPPERSESVMAALEESLGKARSTLPKGWKATLCCSEQYSRIQDIYTMAEEAVDVLWLRFTRPCDTILVPNLMFHCPPYLEEFYKQVEQKLMLACYKLDLELFQKSLRELFGMSDQDVGRSQTRHLLRRVESCLFETNRELISTFNDIDTLKRDVLRTLQQANTLEEYKQSYSRCLTSIFRRILTQTGGHQTKYIRLTKQYIQSHLSESIRLKEAAEHVGLSPVYLSACFKRETGCNFSDYVNHCRVEKAQDMLEDRSAKIQTIAKELGFCDARYFSRMFKSFTGMTPTEYRETVRTMNARQGETAEG